MVNGSYTTSKVNPEDIGFITHMNAIEFDRSREVNIRDPSGHLHA